jgi:exonuclease III
MRIRHSGVPVFLKWLEQSQPEVVCLQELKTSQEAFLRTALEEAGYGAVWNGQKSWNGVAILARGRQPEEARRFSGNAPWAEARPRSECRGRVADGDRRVPYAILRDRRVAISW